MEIEYSKEFYNVLEQLVDKRPHKCAQCGIADGARGYNKDGTRKKFPAIVRLCLDDVFGKPNNARNIAMFCTKCRKPGAEWRATPRRIKQSVLPQLFEKP